MEKLYALITAALDTTELHDAAVQAKKEWTTVKERLEELEIEAGNYDPQEYPKMIGDKTVYNAEEEAELTGKYLPPDPLDDLTDHEG